MRKGTPEAASLLLLLLAAVALRAGCQTEGGSAGEPPWICNPVTGLSAPLPQCAQPAPCTNLALELPPDPIVTPEVVPACRTSDSSAPFFDDGLPLEWAGPDGFTRYACLYRPPAASPMNPRPLVVFLHGGGAGEAGDVYDHTSLRQKAETFHLAPDPLRYGFFLLSVQGRSLHYPTDYPRDGHHHDFYYRDLASPSANPDVANLDRLLDGLVAEGSVDTRRIYVTGWSNGGFFGQMYGIARHAAPTPGGNRVAAVAVFSAADPFHNINHGQNPSCQLDPYPRSALPIFLVSRACDVVACDEAQAEALRTAGQAVEPGHVVAPWMEDLKHKVGDANATWILVDGSGREVSSCTPAALCVPLLAVLNHLRWPNGVADGSGIDHEATMLGFLRDHPLAIPGADFTLDPASPTDAAPVTFTASASGGTPPYAYGWDLCGNIASGESVTTSLAPGPCAVTLTVTDSVGETASVTRTVEVGYSVTIAGVTWLANPPRLKVSGSGFEPGCEVRIDGVPAPQTVFKGPSLLVAKGSGLKAMVPLAVPVQVTVATADGRASAPFSFER